MASIRPAIDEPIPMMINGYLVVKNTLRGQVASPHYKDVDERTATHELYGFKVALKELGILPEEDCFVRPDAFGAYDIPSPLPRGPEELLAYFCDEKCKERIPGRTQEELDAVCEKCAVERLAALADDRDLRVRFTAHGELNALINQIKTAETPTEGAAAEHEARAYLRALVATRAVTERERSIFEAAIQDAGRDRAAPGDETLTPKEVGQLRHLGTLLDDVGKFVSGGPYYPGKPRTTPYTAGRMGRGEEE